jgi:hypothetical protein
MYSNIGVSRTGKPTSKAGDATYSSVSQTE